VNVGSRQQQRERSGNVMDVSPEAQAIRRAVTDVLARPRRSWQNVYGDGRAAERIVDLIQRLPLGLEVLASVHAH
jgi:GDP/UDP-N,N'-diacetylbacillosamine 2-epimerase (hydrolysing)